MKREIEIKLTPAELAAEFCNMNDEGQAQFFIECARIAQGWSGSPGLQWQLVGGHLRDCSCSTEDAREMARCIVFGMDVSQ